MSARRGRARQHHQKTLTKAEGAFHHGTLRDAAIELAMREVETGGHEALSLNQLAHRLGVTGPALYRHFKNRQTLLDVIAQVGHRRFEEAITHAHDEETDPWRSLVAAGLAYVTFASENPGWFRLQFHSAEQPAPRPMRAAADHHGRINRSLAAVFDRTQREIASIYLGLEALLHGLATLTTKTSQRGLARIVLETHVDALRALSKERARVAK